MLDLIVLTYNEEVNLGYCLASAKGLARNIFVVDSGSTDKTVEIAQEHGAQVFTHPFKNQAEQFNWALDNLPLASDWILRLDADEYLSDELREELGAKLPQLDASITGLFIKFRMMFLQRWIRYGGYYPIWILRLFRRGVARYEQAEMDERLILEHGTTERLAHDFIHEDRKGLSAWLIKHDQYAIRQARELLRWKELGQSGDIRAKLFGTYLERKRWMRWFYARLPLFTRCIFYFIYRYFFRFGFLDGIPGLIYHGLHAGWFFFYIDARIVERSLGTDSDL